MDDETKTTLDFHIATASGSRNCFICEEKITHRTVVIDLHTTDSKGDVFRSQAQLVCHPDCAKDFHLGLELILLELGLISL